LAEVAERVGVSARTVSRVVNDEGGFSADTRERVLEAIRAVGYRPNLAARALVTNSTNIVGLMVTFITDPYLPDLAESVTARLAESGRIMILASNHDDDAEQRRVLDAMISHGVDGIIAIPAGGELAPLYEVADLGTPIVVVDLPVDHPRISMVSNDIISGGMQAARHLIDKGHRKIGMVTSERGPSQPDSRRQLAFVSELEGHGIDAVLVSSARPNIESGALGARQLLTENPDITAIFAYNDLMAAGVMRAASTLGRIIPDDVAVIGFDDIDLAAIVSPALTTIRLDRDELGRRASDLLSELIDHSSQTPRASTVPVELVQREST
jgi:LacI family transcriptional regulator